LTTRVVPKEMEDDTWRVTPNEEEYPDVCIDDTCRFERERILWRT